MCTFAFKLIKLKKNLLLGITYEVLWFAFAFAAAYLMVFSIRASISSALYYYIFFSIAFIITYFRFVTFMSYSVLMKSVFVKIVFIKPYNTNKTPTSSIPNKNGISI